MNNSSEWPSTHIALLKRVRVPTDSEAWQEFVLIYGPLIFNYCRKFKLSVNDSEDVCQDVFHNISTSLTTFEYNQKRGRFRSWLGTVTYHEICHFFKKNKRFQNQTGSNDLQELLNQQPGKIDAMWTDEFCSHLYKTAIENIRPGIDKTTWQAFELTWINDTPSQVAAEQLNREITWIYKAKFHVQRKLKDEIQRLSFESVVFQ